MLTSWMVLPLLGLVVGTLSGLLGIGGGVILVPMLVLILPYLGVSSDISVHMALGSSMATASMTLLSSVLVYNRRGVLDRNVFYRFLPGIVLGATAGPYIVHLLPSSVLKVIVGILMLALAINMAFDYEIPATRKLPGTLAMIISGLLVAIASSFAGLSGAALIVPYLVWFGLSMNQAIGIAATCGLPLSIIGMMSYMIVGFETKGLPLGAIGYVYWPAVIFIAITSVPAAQIAARWSFSVPKIILKRALAILFTFMASKMLFF